MNEQSLCVFVVWSVAWLRVFQFAAQHKPKGLCKKNGLHKIRFTFAQQNTNHKSTKKSFRTQTFTSSNFMMIRYSSMPIYQNNSQLSTHNRQTPLSCTTDHTISRCPCSWCSWSHPSLSMPIMKHPWNNSRLKWWTIFNQSQQAE